MASAGKIRAGQAAVEAYWEDSKFRAGLSVAQQRMGAFGSGVRGMGEILNSVASGPMQQVVGTMMNVAQQASGVSRAMRALAATPALFALTALTAAGLGAAAVLLKVEEANTDLSDSMTQATKDAEALRKAQQENACELVQYANKQNHTSREVERADYLIRKLQAAYGDLGLSINMATGEILGLEGGLKKLNERMEASRKSKLQRELEALNLDVRLVKEQLRDWDLLDEILDRGGADRLADKLSGLVRRRVEVQIELGEVPAPGESFKLPAVDTNNTQLEKAQFDLHKMKLEQIEDEHERELALLRFRHRREREQIREATSDLEQRDKLLEINRQKQRIEEDALSKKKRIEDEALARRADELADRALDEFFGNRAQVEKLQERRFEVLGSFNPAVLSQIGPAAAVEKEQLNELRSLNKKSQEQIRAIQAIGPRFS